MPIEVEIDLTGDSEINVDQGNDNTPGTNGIEVVIVGEMTGGGVSDHGELDGLSDDDHPQYALSDGSRGDFEPAGAIEAWDVIPDDSLGVLDIDTAADTIEANLLALGAPQEVVDAVLPDVIPILEFLLTEQPTNVKSAISMIANIIGFLTVKSVATDYQLGLFNQAISLENDTLGVLDPSSSHQTLSDLMDMLGLDPDTKAQLLSGLDEILAIMVTDEPIDVKTAIKNASNVLNTLLVELGVFAAQTTNISTTISTYGDIVTHDADEFALASETSGNELDVRDFGAVIDGTTDDWAAIDAALTQAAATGRDVFIPEGTALVGRTIVVPGNVALRGAGMNRTIITRPGSVTSTIVGYVPGDSTTVEVADASEFAVGNPIHLWDLSHYEGVDIRPHITAIDGNIITFDLPTQMDYDGSIGGRVSTSFSLICSETDSEHGTISDLTVDQAINENDPQGNWIGGTDQVDFTRATIHLEQARYWKVERVKFINAFGDAFSDQGRSYTTGSNHNELAWCIFVSPWRHAIHLGTGNDGSRVHHNIVEGVLTGYGFFFCADVTNCVVESNYFTNCIIGLAHIDERDKHAIITKNHFYNVAGPISVGGTPVDDFSVMISDNVFYADVDCPGAVGMSLNLPNVSFSDNFLYNQVMRVGGKNALIDGNIFVQHEDYTQRPQGTESYAAMLEGADTTFSNNKLDKGFNGVVVAGANRLTASKNTFSNMVTNDWAISYYESADVVIDGSPARVVVGYGATAPRLMVNGLGDNGTDDPAVAGDWNAVSGAKWNGTLVKWADSGQLRFSKFVYGTGWVTELTSAELEAASIFATYAQGELADSAVQPGDLPSFGSIVTTDLDTDVTLAANSDVKIATQKAVKAYVSAQSSAWEVLHDYTVSVAGAPSLSVAGYRFIRGRLSLFMDSAGMNQRDVYVRVNGDTGTNYSYNGYALNSNGLWIATSVGKLSGTTNHPAFCEFSLQQMAGRWLIGTRTVTLVPSDSTVGVAPVVSSYTWQSTTPMSTLDFRVISGGSIDVGSHFFIEGKA